VKTKQTFIVAALLLLAAYAQAADGTFGFRVMPAPPNLTASVQFTEPSGNRILDADETGHLVLTLKNRGQGDAFDCKAEIKSAGRLKGLGFDRSIVIGTVPNGQTVTREISVRADEDVPTANVNLTVEITEANGFDPAPVRLAFATRAFEPPKLFVADLGVNDQNGNGRVEPMEIVELTVRVQNIGRGDAREVTAEIKTGDNVFLAGDSQTRFDLGGLPSGKFKDFKFMFYTNNRIANGAAIPITVDLVEARPRFRAGQALALTMNAPQRKILEVVVQGDAPQQREEITLAGGLSVDVDMNIPEGQKAGKYDIAVVIGNRNYAASGSPDVAFAQQDARIMKEYLIRTMGYDPRNVLYAEDAGLAKFNELFGSDRTHKGRLYNAVREKVSRVFVYYAGHGAPDLESGEAYFVPVDANARDLKANGYRLQTFYDNLAKLPARQITVVLDTCFSGNSEKGLIFKGISPALVKVKKEYRGPAGAVLMTSGGVDQYAAWYDEKRHSLFTYYFLKGLQGDADGNGDRKITVGEMEVWLKENVPYMARRLRGTEQHPVVTGNPADVLATLKR